MSVQKDQESSQTLLHPTDPGVSSQQGVKDASEEIFQRLLRATRLLHTSSGMWLLPRIYTPARGRLGPGSMWATKPGVLEHSEGEERTLADRLAHPSILAPTDGMLTTGPPLSEGDVVPAFLGLTVECRQFLGLRREPYPSPAPQWDCAPTVSPVRHLH